MANAMQMQAVEYIRRQYHVPGTPPLDGMSVHDLVEMTDAAEKNGTMEQLNARLAAQIAQMVMNPQRGTGNG